MAGGSGSGGGGGSGGSTEPLTLKQLQALTELDTEDAYAAGVVASAAELAERLGSDLHDGLCETQVRMDGRGTPHCLLEMNRYCGCFPQLIVPPPPPLPPEQAQLEARAERYGRNAVRPPKEVTFLQLLQEALQDFTILVLLGAGCLSLALELVVSRSGSGEGSWIEGASILAAGARLGQG